MEKPEKKMGSGPESSDNSDRRRRPSDWLTALPEHILHKILKLLPYRSAVATSVLSSHWRHLWEHRWPEPSCLHIIHPNDFVADVNRQIELHPPPRRLDALTISMIPFTSHFLHLRRCMKYAHECGIADLHINLHNGPKFRFYYESPSLVRLTLNSVLIARTCRYKNLTSLEAISLHRVYITTAVLENLIDSCPALRVLELHRCDEQDLKAVTIRPAFGSSRITTLRVVDCRNIYNIDPSVTRLRCLYLLGLRLNSMPVVFSPLEDVCMSWTWSSDKLNTQPSWGNINPTKTFAHVQFLTVGGVPFQNFAFALRTSLALGSLRELQILMVGMSANQFGTIYKFFDNVLCPSLERLFIELPSTCSDPRMESSSQMEEEEHPPLEGISFENLRIIKMKNFRGVSMEIDLVKFFLMKAIGLESMIIVAADVAEKVSTYQKHNQADEPTVIRQQLELLPKASTNTKLKFCQSDVGLVQPRHHEVQNGSCGCNP